MLREGTGLCPAAKKRGSHAHVVRAFLHGHLEVAGHSHRQLGEAGIPFAEPIPRGLEKLRQLTKAGPRGLGAALDRTHGHEADEVDVRRGRERGEDIEQRVRFDAGFVGFPGGVDLEEDVAADAEFPGDPVDRFPKIQRVDGVDRGDQREDLADLVPLEAADEMEFVVARVSVFLWRKRELLKDFLNAVFAEELGADVVGGDDGFDRMSLADPDQFNVGMHAIRTVARGGDAGVDGGGVGS